MGVTAFDRKDYEARALFRARKNKANQSQIAAVGRRVDHEAALESWIPAYAGMTMG